MKHNLTQFAQELRKNQTKEETRLWYQFLRRYPHRFRRQHPFGRYISDFYCAKAKLVVELDGSQHYDAHNRLTDEVRSAYLEEWGFKVIRFSNTDINLRFQDVCAAIDTIVKDRITEGI